MTVLPLSLKFIDRHNKANLEAVEKAIFVLCLDKPPPYSTQSPSVMEEPTSSVTARQCLHGDGTDYNSANRWFDKIIQVHLYKWCCINYVQIEPPIVQKLNSDRFNNVFVNSVIFKYESYLVFLYRYFYPEKNKDCG